MYFHTPTTPAPKFDDPQYHKKILTQKQTSFLAISTDGVHFKPRARQMGEHYLRVWQDSGDFPDSVSSTTLTTAFGDFLNFHLDRLINSRLRLPK